MSIDLHNLIKQYLSRRCVGGLSYPSSSSSAVVSLGTEQIDANGGGGMAISLFGPASVGRG